MKYASTLYIGMDDDHSQHNIIIERHRDGCRTSSLVACSNYFHTLLPPCHPYITIHFMEIIFSTCSTDFLRMHVCHIKRQFLLYQYQLCMHNNYCLVAVTSLHLTEISQ